MYIYRFIYFHRTYLYFCIYFRFLSGHHHYWMKISNVPPPKVCVCIDKYYVLPFWVFQKKKSTCLFALYNLWLVLLCTRENMMTSPSVPVNVFPFVPIFTDPLSTAPTDPLSTAPTDPLSTAPTDPSLLPPQTPSRTVTGFLTALLTINGSTDQYIFFCLKGNFWKIAIRELYRYNVTDWLAS